MNQLDILANSLSFFGKQFIIVDPIVTRYLFHEEDLAFRDTHHLSVSYTHLALALALSENVLKGHGAWRVHGGGLAGTIQAFVPLALLETYQKVMDDCFGAGSCHVLSIRPEGGVRLI